MTVKLLTEQNLEFLSLTGGCTGSSEYTLVKTPHFWKSHVAAQLIHVTCIFVPQLYVNEEVHIYSSGNVRIT